MPTIKDYVAICGETKKNMGISRKCRHHQYTWGCRILEPTETQTYSQQDCYFRERHSPVLNHINLASHTGERWSKSPTLEGSMPFLTRTLASLWFFHSHVNPPISVQDCSRETMQWHVWSQHISGFSAKSDNAVTFMNAQPTRRRSHGSRRGWNESRTFWKVCDGLSTNA